MAEAGETWLAKEIRRLRTELAWLYGDTRHGGPDHTDDLADLRKRLQWLTEPAKNKHHGSDTR